MVELPKKIVLCKWVFKRKDGTLGIEDTRCNASSKGLQLDSKFDYTDVFSSIVKHSLICPLLGVVAKSDKIAFLHGELEERIYIQQPKYFIVSGKEEYVLVE